MRECTEWMCTSMCMAITNKEGWLKTNQWTKYVKFFDSDLMLNFQNVSTILWTSSVVTVEKL